MAGTDTHQKPPAALKPPKIGTIESFRCERCRVWVPFDTKEKCPKAPKKRYGE